MRRLVSVLLLTGLGSANAWAHEQILELDASKIDVAKWCVYANTLYSRGAIIDVKGRYLVCEQEAESGPGANRLAWRRAD